MPGPNSVPLGDKALHQRLMEKLCPVHTAYVGGRWIECDGNKEEPKAPCRVVTRREWYISRNCLETGKTK